MASTYRIITVIIITLSLISCHHKSDERGPWITNAVPIVEQLRIAATSEGIDHKIESQVEAYFQPLLLPFSIRYNKSDGFYIEGAVSKELITPIGVFGAEFSTSGKKTINGIEITPSDFVVSLVNKRSMKKELFKITGFNHLKISITGKTVVNAESGYVEIDVTNSKIDEILFYNNAYSIVMNRTNKPVKFYFEHGQAHQERIATYTHTLPSQTMSFILTGEMINHSISNPHFYIIVDNDDVRNDSFKRLKKRFNRGEIVEIVGESTNISLNKIIM